MSTDFKKVKEEIMSKCLKTRLRVNWFLSRSVFIVGSVVKYTCIQSLELPGQRAVVQSGQGQCPQGDGLQEAVGTSHGPDNDVQDKRKVQEQMVALSVIMKSKLRKRW